MIRGGRKIPVSTFYLVKEEDKTVKLRKTALLLAFAALFIMVGAMGAQAYVKVDPADYTGSRTTSRQIIATDGWTGSNGGFKVAWEIEFEGSEFDYKYTFSATNDGDLQKAINFLALRVSPDFSAWDVAPGDYHIANVDFLGYKFAALYWDNLNSKNLTVEFDSLNQPVWGSFLAANLFYGIPIATAVNAGVPFFMDEGGNIGCFIPVPDSKIPVPPSILLLGSGLLGLVGMRFRKIAKLTV